MEDTKDTQQNAEITNDIELVSADDQIVSTPPPEEGEKSADGEPHKKYNYNNIKKFLDLNMNAKTKEDEYFSVSESTDPNINRELTPDQIYDRKLETIKAIINNENFSFVDGKPLLKNPKVEGEEDTTWLRSHGFTETEVDNAYAGIKSYVDFLNSEDTQSNIASFIGAEGYGANAPIMDQTAYYLRKLHEIDTYTDSHPDATHQEIQGYEKEVNEAFSTLSNDAIDPDDTTKNANIARIVATVGDLTSIALGPTPWGIGAGLASTAVNLGADIYDDDVTKGQVLRNLALNVGFDVLGAVGLKSSKIGRIYDSMRPILQSTIKGLKTAAAGYGGYSALEGMSEASKMIVEKLDRYGWSEDAFKSLSVKDVLVLMHGVVGAAAGTSMAKQLASPSTYKAAPETGGPGEKTATNIDAVATPIAESVKTVVDITGWRKPPAPKHPRQREINNLNTKVEETKGTVKDLEADLAPSEKKVNELQDAVNKKGELKTASNEAKVLYNESNKNISSKENDINYLTRKESTSPSSFELDKRFPEHGEVKNARKKLDSFKTLDIRALENLKTINDAKVPKWNSEISSNKAAITELTRRKATLQLDDTKTPAEKAGDLAAIESEISLLETKTTEAQKNIDAYNDVTKKINTHKKATEIVEQANKVAAEIETELTTLREEHAKLSEDVTKTLQDYTAYEKTLAEDGTEGKLSDLNEELTPQRQQLTQAKAEYDSYVKDLEYKIYERGRAQTDYNRAVESKSRIDKEVAELTKKKTELVASGATDAEIKSLNIKLEMKTKQAEAINKTYEKYNTKFRRAISWVEDLRKKVFKSSSVIGRLIMAGPRWETTLKAENRKEQGEKKQPILHYLDPNADVGFTNYIKTNQKRIEKQKRGGKLNIKVSTMKKLIPKAGGGFKTGDHATCIKNGGQWNFTQNKCDMPTTTFEKAPLINLPQGNKGAEIFGNLPFGAIANIVAAYKPDTEFTAPGPEFRHITLPKHTIKNMDGYDNRIALARQTPNRRATSDAGLNATIATQDNILMNKEVAKANMENATFKDKLRAANTQIAVDEAKTNFKQDIQQEMYDAQNAEKTMLARKAALDARKQARLNAGVNLFETINNKYNEYKANTSEDEYATNLGIKDTYNAWRKRNPNMSDADAIKEFSELNGVDPSSAEFNKILQLGRIRALKAEQLRQRGDYGDYIYR